jgi:acyl carrier protein
MLVAYIVPIIGSQINAQDLRPYLASRLPEYMLPAAYILIEALPLTPNGKLDINALPDPKQDDMARPLCETAPRNPLENQLAQIWKEVLRVKYVSIFDNFFDLGGHSLLAVRMIAQIESKLGKSLQVSTIFNAPTIAQLAAFISNNQPSQPANQDFEALLEQLEGMPEQDAEDILSRYKSQDGPTETDH